jgi:hypothetical protein
VKVQAGNNSARTIEVANGQRARHLRRALIASGAALTAALARWSAEPALAGNDGDITMGISNPQGPPVITTTSLTTVCHQGPGFAVVNTGDSPTLSVGIAGTSTTGFGMYGHSGASAGVFGEATNAGTAQPGVFGTSSGGAGVAGTSASSVGVLGLSEHAYGVSGGSTTQAGVWGSSSSNVGVVGSSGTGDGVYGISQSSNGVNGVSTSGIGVYGSSPSGTAGRFDGNVLINGVLTVTGQLPPTIAVPGVDGAPRRLYVPAIPEAFYEDVGLGSIVNGVGIVGLDPEFAALIQADTYHVFLTPRGNCKGLYVSVQGSNGFEVRELQEGTSSIDFSYRVVAHPKDAPGAPLERVTLPPSPAPPRLAQTEPLDVPTLIRNLPGARADGTQ